MGLLSPTVKASLESGTVQVATLVQLDFSFGIERFWSGVHVLNHEGQEWQPVGDAGDISSMESSSDLRANGLRLSLTIPHMDGAPSPRFQNVRPEQYKNRLARTILAFFDESFSTVIHTVERRYFMDVLTYNVDPRRATTVSLNVESELMRGGKRSTKRITDAQLRDDFPGDLGFQYLSYLASGVEVAWGREGTFFR